MIEVMFGLVGLVVGLPIAICTCFVIYEFITDIRNL
jgi:hypothetical protein